MNDSLLFAISVLQWLFLGNFIWVLHHFYTTVALSFVKVHEAL